MQQSELPQVIEAILFVTGEPVLIQDMQKALDVSDIEMSAAIDTLEHGLTLQRRGICLKRFGAHIQLSTRPEYAQYVERMLQPIQKMSLSQAALETLAIIAYRQPVTRLEVESIRGVKCDYSIASLANKQMIEEKGRKESLGRPILYGTTDNFLSHFGLASISDLPKPPDEKLSSTDESIMAT